VRFEQKNNACGDCERSAASMKVIVKRFPSFSRRV